MPGDRVLVVDDDPDIVVYLTSFLEDNGFEVRSTGDAAHALALLEDYDPDVILADVLLPGRSGLDLLVTVRRDRRRRDIAVVMITGMDEILQHDCQSYLVSHDGVPGPDAVIGKPIDPPTLLAVLAELLRRRALATSAAASAH
jgi:CheY-like chemotaxis protein